MLCCAVQASEFNLVSLSLATGPAGSVLVTLTPAINTSSTTAAGEAAEEEDTAAPVLPNRFTSTESCVCAGRWMRAVLLIYRAACADSSSVHVTVAFCCAPAASSAECRSRSLLPPVLPRPLCCRCWERHQAARVLRQGPDLPADSQHHHWMHQPQPDLTGHGYERTQDKGQQGML